MMNRADIEQNANRVGEAHSRNNFGMLEIDWDESASGATLLLATCWQESQLVLTC